MCKINEVVNKFIKAYSDTDFVCENLRNVKHASKLYKSLNNKLQYWSYRQVLDKLDQLSEIEGFNLIKIDPAYTSQTCSNCGTILKSNRNGEFYNCSCGLIIDADTNAAIKQLENANLKLNVINLEQFINAFDNSLLYRTDKNEYIDIIKQIFFHKIINYV